MHEKQLWFTSGLRLASLLASLTVMSIGGFVFLGWIFGIETLKSVFSGYVTMKANTAAGFILSGSALWATQSTKTSNTRRWIARIGAFLSCLIGAATLIEYAVGWNLGIDLLFAADPPGGVGTSSPGRMAPQTAVCFTFLGAAILLLNFGRFSQIGWAQFLAGLSAIIAMLALIGYAYGARVFYAWGVYTQMALHTSFSFFLLSLGVLFFRADRGLMAIISSDLMGSRVARRMLPVVIVVPPILGGLRILFTERGTIDHRLATGVLVIANIAITSSVLFYTAWRLNRLDASLGSERRQLRQTLSSIQDGVISCTFDGRITYLNPVAERLVGQSCNIAQGHSVDEIVRIADENTGLALPNPMLDVVRTRADVVFRRDSVLLARDGGRVPIEGRASPIVDPRGVMTGIVLVFRDGSADRKATEDRERLASIVDSSQDAIISKSLDGIITSWNRGAESIFGYQAEEVIGRHISIIIPPDRIDEMEAILREIRLGGTAGHIETKRQTKDGRVLDMSITISPIRDAVGKITGASKVGRDITAQKRAELALNESESRMRSVVDHIVDGIITINERGIIESFNPAAEQIFGYQAAIAIGRKTNALIEDQDRRSHNDFFEDCMARGKAGMIGIGREVVGLRRDGSTFPMELAVSEFQVEGKRYFTGIARDITDRKRVEAELRENAATLVADLSRRLIRAQEDERRRIARELHDEVGQTLTAAKISLDGATSDLDEASRVTRLSVSSNLVLRSLDQIRDLSRLLRPSLLDDLGLDAALHALIEELARGARMDAEVQIDPDLGRSDPESETVCYRIAQEALTNAVRHSRASRLRLVLNRTEEGLVLLVEDNGIGFDVITTKAAAIQGKSLGILGLFERASLAGGRAFIESQPGSGTRVRLLLPEPELVAQTGSSQEIAR